MYAETHSWCIMRKQVASIFSVLPNTVRRAPLFQHVQSSRPANSTGTDRRAQAPSMIGGTYSSSRIEHRPSSQCAQSSYQWNDIPFSLLLIIQCHRSHGYHRNLTTLTPVPTAGSKDYVTASRPSESNSNVQSSHHHQYIQRHLSV